MALDPSIFGMANKPTVALQTPYDTEMKALQLQQAQQQGQLGALGIKDKMQAQADAEQFKTRFGMSPALAKSTQEMALAQKQQAIAEATFQKTMREADAVTRKKTFDDMGEFVRVASTIQGSKSPDEFRGRALELAKRFDPDGSKGWSQLAQNITPEALGQMIQQTMGHAEWIKKEFPAETYQLKETSTGFAKFSPKEGTLAPVEGGLKPMPKSSSMATIQLGDVSGALKDPAEERISQMVAAGKLAAPPMSRNNPRNLRIIARADEIKQSGGGEGLDATTFPTRQAAMKFFTTGKGADAFRQQETILHHAKVVGQIMDALDNGNVQLANKIGTQYGIQMGSDKATNMKLAGQILSAEVGKYLAGGQSTQSERDELSQLLPAFSSPQQFKGAMTTLSNLVEGQRKSWVKQKEAALGGKPMDSQAEDNGKTDPAASQMKEGTVSASGKYIWVNGAWKKRG